MSDVASFIRARLDEDQAAAEAADGIPVYQDSWTDHIDRHDPARVLAQVAALRVIVDEHGPRKLRAVTFSSQVDPAVAKQVYDETEKRTICSACQNDRFQPVDYPCPTLRHLAAIWRDHPEFDPAWAVE